LELKVSYGRAPRADRLGRSFSDRKGDKEKEDPTHALFLDEAEMKKV
jgi:hypothetical protein